MSTARSTPNLRERVATAILEAAAAVLAREGHRAKMSDVAVAAGVARATLYRYFPTREALLEALGRYAVQEAGDRLEAARLDQVPVDEGFIRTVRALVAVGDYFVVLAREHSALEPAEFDRRVTGALSALVERGQANGEIRDDVPTAWLAQSLLGLVQSVLTSAPWLGSEDTVSAVTSLFLDGARGGGGPAPPAVAGQTPERPTIAPVPGSP